MLATATLVVDLALGRGDRLFEAQIVLWLWLTVLFANFAEAMAEGRGKAQADSCGGPRQTPWRTAWSTARRRRRCPRPDS